MRSLPAATNYIRFNMDFATGGDSNIDITVGSYRPRSSCNSKRRGTIRRDLPGCWFRRSIRHDLEQPRDEPILQDRMVVFCRDDI